MGLWSSSRKLIYRSATKLKEDKREQLSNSPDYGGPKTVPVPIVSQGSSSQPSGICGICRGLDPRHFDPNSSEAIIRVKDIQRGSSCWGCNLLLRVVDWTPNRNSDIDRFPESRIEKLLPAVKLEELGVKISHCGHGGLCIEFTPVVYPHLKNQILVYAEGLAWKDLCTGNSTGREVPWSFWMDMSLSWAKEEIEKCKGNHPLCQPPQHALPTRVLDLGPTETTDCCDSVRLVETSGQQGQYACLSHCWGTSRKLVTTRKNLGDHKKRIAFEALPKTFQDAVIVSRKLGIRYLWIDSLCIIQNDKDDWHRESSRMAQVYKHSTLCIAASSAADDLGGLQDTFQPLENLGIVRRGDLACNIFVYRSVQEFGPRSAPHMFENGSGPFSRLPLMQRGWVLQERLLAPRFLHFAGRVGVVLECREFTVSESGFHNRGSPRSKMSHAISLSRPSPQGLSDLWRGLVAEFSSLQLTREDDVLPAIAGLAKELQQYKKCRYFAGLWEDSFIEDLMWTTGEGIMFPRPKPKRWRAPSWSWASVNEQTAYFELMVEQVRPELDDPQVILQCYVKGVHCTPVLDEMGQLVSGWAELEGILASALLARVSATRYSLIQLSQFSIVGQIFSDPWVFPEDGTRSTREEISYLHLGSTSLTYFGLALRRSHNVFNRIGLIKLDRSSTDPVIGSIQALGSPTTITIY